VKFIAIGSYIREEEIYKISDPANQFMKIRNEDHFKLKASNNDNNNKRSRMTIYEIKTRKNRKNIYETKS
jgi:hypothetical protein